MLPNLMIIDNFLDNPQAARQQALNLTYPSEKSAGNYAGSTSTQPLQIKHMTEAVSRRLNVPLQGADGTLHAHCRLTLKGDKGRTGVHIDPCFYSGILFLNLPEHCKGGTDFYVHKRTGLDGIPSRPADLLAAGYQSPNDCVEDIVNKDTFQSERWQRSMRVPMCFNRLLLFSPWLFHNAGPGFGTNTHDGRLVCLLFFNPASK